MRARACCIRVYSLMSTSLWIDVPRGLPGLAVPSINAQLGAFGVQDAHAAVLTNEGQALTIGRVDPGLCPGLPTPRHQVEVGGHN